MVANIKVIGKMVNSMEKVLIEKELMKKKRKGSGMTERDLSG
jgi:hypothetical protein